MKLVKRHYLVSIEFCDEVFFTFMDIVGVVNGQGKVMSQSVCVSHTTPSRFISVQQGNIVESSRPLSRVENFLHDLNGLSKVEPANLTELPRNQMETFYKIQTQQLNNSLDREIERRRKLQK